MTEEKALQLMVPPGKKRPSVGWLQGVIQIFITRACDLKCFNCTQLSNLSGKPVMITVEEFEKALQSLEGYWGVVGMFGGNPATHPQFGEMCEIFQKYFPKRQRGLWCNHPRGKGAIMRETFNPKHSNLNVHLSREAYEEFVRDWPECKPELKGMDGDSLHGPVYVSMKDMDQLPFPNGKLKENTEENRWELISKCDINQHWSAMLCPIPGKGLKAFFCEIAGAMAMRYYNKPEWAELGMDPVPGWWKRPMLDFRDQVKTACHNCGVPMRLRGQLGVGGDHEEVSAYHMEDYNPKDPKREVHQISHPHEKTVSRMTYYIQNAK